VPGIDDSYVDLDNFNGTDADFLQWINPKGGFPMPIPPEPSEVVNVSITTPENVSVRVMINGKVVRDRPLRPAKRGPDIVR
jgi:hypothetical protein